MNVIFLDFDGVLTTLDSKWKIIPDKYKLLKNIIDSTNANIVISSFWRRNNLKDTIDFLTNIERNNYLNNHPFPFIDRIVGQTDSRDNEMRFYHQRSRGELIQSYIDFHNDITNYVIIDDENNMLESQQDHFVQTLWTEGLTEKDVQDAINILNNEKIRRT